MKSKWARACGPVTHEMPKKVLGGTARVKKMSCRENIRSLNRCILNQYLN
jgi:hypothetical protein